MKSKVLVLYHFPCPDGAFAALAARMSLGTINVSYVPHSTTVPINLEAYRHYDTLYLLDYSGPPGFIDTACQQFSRVYLLDHHKTAQISDAPNFAYMVKMDNSGCIIALQWFSIQLGTRL